MLFFVLLLLNKLDAENEIHSDNLPFTGSYGQQSKPYGAGSESAEYFLHTVTKGRALSIASMYNVSVDDIVRINPGSKELIREGQSLKIPQKSDNNSQQGQFHTIQAGETLYQLTVKYNITAEAICKANPGLSASNFRIGQVIVIPPQNSTEIAIQEEITKELAAAETPKKEWKDMHKVQRKETIFSISREYGITEEELIAPIRNCGQAN